MAHDAKGVANELINMAIDEGCPVTPMQIQKLLYYCHAWTLGLCGRPLLEQPVEAWMFGPVVKSVYLSLRAYRGNPVTEPIAGVDAPDFRDEENDVIEQVWRKYGYLTGRQLSTMTHRQGTPWHQVMYGKRRKGDVNPAIPNGLIREYYAEKARAFNGNE